MKKKFLSSLFAIGMIATAFVMSCSKKDDSVAVTSVQLSDNEIVIMGGGGTATLTATILPENADNKAVTWTSSAPEIVSVNENGVVTALAEEGSATIIVTTQDGGKTAVCKITIIQPRITMVTKASVGESIDLIINVANEGDKEGVWIDLNNNGKKDAGEGSINFNDEEYTSCSLQSQTITLYGKVTKLTCMDNNLTQLNLSHAPQLVSLNCQDNLLKQLDVSKNTKLTELYCEYNELEQLDISKNVQLIKLGCSSNQLKQLDISKNTKLTGLSCSSNNLQQLDISRNTQLTSLYCEYNKLTQEGMAKLLSDLPAIKGTKKGEAYIVGNSSDKNYSNITEEQKQAAKAKNWILYVDRKPINE